MKNKIPSKNVTLFTPAKNSALHVLAHHFPSAQEMLGHAVTQASSLQSYSDSLICLGAL